MTATIEDAARLSWLTSQVDWAGTRVGSISTWDAELVVASVAVQRHPQACVLWGEEAVIIHGPECFPALAARVLGRSAVSLLPDQPIAEMMQSLCDSDQPQVHEVVVAEAADGTESRHLSVSLAPLRAHDGATRGALVTWFDHTAASRRVAELERANANLEVALETNRGIGAAIGILMKVHRVDEATAFSLLRTCSQHLNRKLATVAEFVRMAGTLPASLHDLEAVGLG